MDDFEWLMSRYPGVEMAKRYQSGWLKEVLPEVHALYCVPQVAEHHPEICTGIHTQLCLNQAELLGADLPTRFAVLTHDLGKAETPPEEWPRHLSHEVAGLKPLTALCDRMAVPADVRALAMAMCEFHLRCHRIFASKPASVMRFLRELGVSGNRTMLHQFLMACKADARGRISFENRPYPQVEYLMDCFDAVDSIPYPENAKDGSDPDWTRANHRKVSAIQEVQSKYPQVKAADVAC